MPTRQPSLIERMGGAEAASGLLISSVEIFYHKLVSDPELKRFFDGRDIEKLKSKQVEFLAYVFGGPEAYNGKGIFEAHEHLIRDEGELSEVLKVLRRDGNNTSLSLSLSISMFIISNPTAVLFFSFFLSCIIIIIVFTNKPNQHHLLSNVFRSNRGAF